MLQNWVRLLKLEQYSAFRTIPTDMGSKTSFFLEPQSEASTQIALIGHNPEAAELIRSQLYSFQSTDNQIDICDLGNLRNENDDFMIQLCTELISSNIIPIIIGQDQPTVKAQIISTYQSIGQCNCSIFSPNLFHNEFLHSNPKQLDSLQWIGKQIHQLDSGNYPDASVHRLGQIRNNINEIEPHIRESNAFIFSTKALRFPDAPAQNGFSASAITLAEACQMMRYIGFNEKLASISFPHYLYKRDLNQSTANSIAQMIWYLIEGISKRTIEDLSNNQSKQFFRINLDDSEETLEFIKSKQTGRWWLKTGEHSFKACSYEDYYAASQNKITDRVINYLREIQ